MESSLLAQPSLAIGDASILEGDSGTNLLNFVVTLSAAATNTISVNYATLNGTALGNDFVQTSGTLTFDPGVTNQLIQVGIRGDTLYETNETFYVSLSSPVNATISRSLALGTILNDDLPPLVSISDASRLEGDSGTNNLRFQVTLSALTGVRILVIFSTSDGSATAGSDYVTTNGVVSFVAGSLTRTQTINVPIIGDLIFERDESFYVTITSISNAVGGKVQAIGTILNDETCPSYPPASDAFETATMLDSITNLTITGGSSDASKQPLEPDHAGKAGGKSVWWSWRAPASGSVTVDTLGSCLDTLLAIYTGSSLGSLQLVASNDNASANELTSRCSFNALSNTVYTIAVDGANGAGGSIVLHLNLRADEFIISAEPRDDFATTENDVFTLLETNNVLYVGGGIRNFGRPKRVGSLIRPSGELDPHLPRITGSIFSVVSDNEGGWYVGGQFTSVGNIPRTNLVHLFSDLSVDPSWKPDPNDAVLALALSEGTLYVAGNFIELAGETRSGIGALTASNGVATSWNPWLLEPVVNAINCMVVTSNSVYVGGWFWRVGTAFRDNIAELDKNTGYATDWDPGATEYTGFGVTSLAVSETHVYASGAFTQLGGEDRHHLGSIDRKTGLASSWNPSPDLFVWQLVLDCNTLYAGGGFTQIAGESRTRLVAFDVGSGALLDWNPGPIDSDVSALALSARTLYVGGWFTTIGGTDRRYVAALDLQSARATDWAPPVSLPLGNLAVQSGIVFAGLDGRSEYRRHVAAIDATTGEVLPWNADVRSTYRLEQPIRSMAMAGDTLYLGGSFTNIAGETRNGLAAVDAATGALKDWDPKPGGSNVSVNAMVIVSNMVYIGGQFTSVGGALRANLAAVDLSTGVASTWAPTSDAVVEALEVRETNIFVGTDSLEAVGFPFHTTVFGISLDTGEPTSFEQNMYLQGSPFVAAIIAESNAVYAAGSFVGGFDPDFVARNNIAALDPVTAAFTGWDPDTDNSIFALAKTRTSILAGGAFRYVGANRREFLAEIDPISAVATDWHPQPNLWVKSIVARKNAYYVGGDFWTVNGRDCPGLAVFPPEGSPRITVQPDDVLIEANQTLSLKAQVQGQEPLLYQWRRSGTNIVGATHSELVVASAQPGDSGTYDLRVTNGLGLVTSLEVIATVYQAPLITLEPISQTALPGDTVTFTAAAIGAPTPRFQWRLNGANIPGATGPTLTIANLQTTNGGSYSVAVANVGGGALSEVATLLVQGPSLAFGDNFAGRGVITADSGAGLGSNAVASSEVGEPNHAGKPGGKSVWLSWIAPTNGIAKFSTLGSSFDTLLGVYTGSAISKLSEVASDEDRGGFFTSEATFNAVGGTEYIIAIDGLAGASGNIVLSWSFDATQVEFPRIISQPFSRTVARGDDATFEVSVSSPTSPTYQWFRGCNAIPGATNANLTLMGVGRGDLGGYRVFVMNASTHIAESQEAFLEIGPAAETFSHDKFEDLLLTANIGTAFAIGAKSKAQALATAGGFISVAAGSVGSQQFNNTGSSSELGEPIPCGIIGGASRWFGLRPAISGTFLLDTSGSKIDTLLALFQGPDLLHIQLLSCDDNGAPDHIRSRLRYTATAGVPYYVMVDGVNAAQGDIALNWRFGVPPAPVFAQSVRHPHQGDSLTLTATITNATPDLTYQWLRNGLNINGATNSTFALLNLQIGQGGSYSLLVSNFAGLTTSTAAVINVAVPVRLSYEANRVNGAVQVHLTGPPSSGFSIDLSSNLVDWVPVYIYTNTIEAPIDYLDSGSADLKQRFYQLSPYP